MWIRRLALLLLVLATLGLQTGCIAIFEDDDDDDDWGSSSWERDAREERASGDSRASGSRR